MFVAVACIVTGVWGATLDDPFDDWIAIGNKGFHCVHRGIWFQAWLCRPAPTFGIRVGGAANSDFSNWNSQWGRENHWLRLPELQFSLWLPFSISLAVMAITVVPWRARTAHGFPISQAQNSTLDDSQSR